MPSSIFAPKRGRIIEIQLYSASLYFKLLFEWGIFKQFELRPAKNTAAI